MNRLKTRLPSIRAAKAMVASTTTFWNFGVTLMLKNLYAARVTPAATKVPITACMTMPSNRALYRLLIKPMNTPSMAAYANTSGGETFRRNETNSTATNPTRPDRIRPGRYSAGGTSIHASAAKMINVPMVTAVLVTTSSRVITPCVLVGTGRPTLAVALRLSVRICGYCCVGTLRVLLIGTLRVRLAVLVRLGCCGRERILL